MVKTLPEVGRLRFLYWELNMIISLLVDNVYIGIFLSVPAERSLKISRFLSVSFSDWR